MGQNELSDLQQKVSYRELDFFYLLKLRSNWYQKKLEQNLLMVPTEVYILGHLKFVLAHVFMLVQVNIVLFT